MTVNRVLLRSLLERLAWQLAALPLVFAANEISRELFTIVIGVLVIVGGAVAVLAAVILTFAAVTTSDAPEGPSDTMIIAAKNTGTYALIGLGLAVAGAVGIARLLEVPIPGRPILVLLAWALVLVSVPAWTWARATASIWLPQIRVFMARRR